MSHTIRRKGWHVLKSSKWNAQINNDYYGIRFLPEPYKSMKNASEYYENQVKRNKERLSERKDQLIQSTRDGFWKTLRWTRYVNAVPRVKHKMEISRSLKMNDDYVWDEKAARKNEAGHAQWWYD